MSERGERGFRSRPREVETWRRVIPERSWTRQSYVVDFKGSRTFGEPLPGTRSEGIYIILHFWLSQDSDRIPVIGFRDPDRP